MLEQRETLELIKKAKQSIDDREAKIKAYKDSIDALWNDFDNLTIEQQKSLLKHKMHGFHKGGFCKPGFHKDGHHKPHRHHKGPRPECPRK